MSIPDYIASTTAGVQIIEGPKHDQDIFWKFSRLLDLDFVITMETPMELTDKLAKMAVSRLIHISSGDRKIGVVKKNNVSGIILSLLKKSSIRNYYKYNVNNLFNQVECNLPNNKGYYSIYSKGNQVEIVSVHCKVH